MGTFIHDIGTLTIPTEKLSAFLTDAAVVAEQGGLMARNIIYVFGRQIALLSFPDFSNMEEQYIDFDYSYYENDTWENVGISRRTGIPYSGKIGWKHFNKTVQALYILAELYSDTPYASMNDSRCLQVETIQWLRYVLKRELHYTWRSQIWELMEIEARNAHGICSIRKKMADMLILLRAPLVGCKRSKRRAGSWKWSGF